MKTLSTRAGKLKLALFLTLCAVVLGCAVFLCFDISNKHNTTTASAATSVAIPIYSAGTKTGVTFSADKLTATASYTDYNSNQGGMIISNIDSSLVTYTLSSGAYARYIFSDQLLFMEHTNTAVSSGSHTITFSLKDTSTCSWSDGTKTPKTFTLRVNGESISASFTYTRNNQIPYEKVTGGPTVTGNPGKGQQTFSVASGTGSATINSSTGAITPTKPGTIRVTLNISAIGQYNDGSYTLTLTIIRDISNASIGAIGDQIYNHGLAITPTTTVTDPALNSTLTAGTDFTYSYSNNTAVGQATITVTGRGNYSGTKSTTFTILGIDISNCTIGAIPACTYNGTAQTPTATVTLNGTTLSSATDFTFSYSNNVNAGEATLTVKGKGNYSGKNTKTFKISPRSISGVTVAEIAAQAYTGSAIEPLPRITDLGRALTKDTEYSLAYEHNVEVGTATVTVTGKGNFEGVKTVNFNIVADVNKATVTGIEKEYEWTGAAITPEPVVTLSGVKLVKGADYTVSYANNTGLGTATVTVTGKGLYNSSATVTFEIVEVDISAAIVSGLEKNYEYTGSAIAPDITVALRGKALVKDTDYTVTYRNNVNIGAAVVDITGIGNYKGLKSAAFTVGKANIARAQVTAINASYEQTGAEISPVPVVTIDGVNLIKDADYTISYASNVNIGTATYTITGIGNYTGSISGTFKITIAQPKVEVVYVSYNGTDRLFVGKALPEIRAIATYDGAPVEGTVVWDMEEAVLKVGTNDYSWKFTPADLNKFAVVTGAKTLTAEKPNYVAIRAEWQGGAQPELFTSTSISVLKQNLKITGILSSTDTDEIVGGYSILGSWDVVGATNTVTMPAHGGNNFTITVTFGSWTDTIVSVEIKDVVITELTVEAADGGITTDYSALDIFDVSSVKVTAKFNDGSERVLPFGNKGYTVVYENGADALRFGDTKVTLSFTENGVTKTAEIDGLNVKKADPVITPSVGGSTSAGKSLSELVLVANGDAPKGTFVWDNSAYELQSGTNRCYYTFTPDDTDNYSVVRGYVDITAEASQPVVSTGGEGGSSSGWIIAIVIICLVIVIVAIIALLLALKLRRVTTTDDDGFYDNASGNN